VYHALATADRYDCESVALPAISTGIFGFPKERGARIILDAIEKFIAGDEIHSVVEIQIVLIDQPSIDVFATEFGRRWPGSQS
jgi:putative ATPase